MKTKQKSTVIYIVLKWIARIWSLLFFLFILTMIFIPDPNATGEPIPTEDMVLLGFWVINALGLMLGWIWERLGAFVAIISLILREVLFVILKGTWMVDFMTFWVLILPPAILYLIVWHQAQKVKSASEGAEKA